MRVRPRRSASRESGFTLVELLVVIAVLGILTAIAVPAFLSQRAKAHDAAVRQDLRAAATAVNAFYLSEDQAATVGAGPWIPLSSIPSYLPGTTVPTPTAGTSVEVRPLGSGEYCVRASSTKGTTSGSSRTYFWYRSTGGTVPGGATATTAGC